MRLLALDHGSRCGWAVGDGSRLPAVGSRKNPHSGGNAELEPFFEAHHGWLSALVRDFAPTLIVWERPVLARHTTHASVEVTFGLQAITGLVCREQHLPCRRVTVQQVKLVLTGNGRASKDEMVEAARDHGLTILHHDEADAFGVWLWTLRMLDPEAGMQFRRPFRLEAARSPVRTRRR
jgi:Holliday junction resolvasome RuvABC endonuclease subunit